MALGGRVTSLGSYSGSRCPSSRSVSPAPSAFPPPPDRRPTPTRQDGTKEQPSSHLGSISKFLCHLFSVFFGKKKKSPKHPGRPMFS